MRQLSQMDRFRIRKSEASGVIMAAVVFTTVWALLSVSFPSAVAQTTHEIAGLAADTGVDRLSVGLGMVPRGEVGLIFASIGKGLGVVNDAVFSALVVMIMISTLLTHPALKWSLSRHDEVGT